MIQSRIENETIEFEINGDIPTIVCELLSLISAIHRVFLKAGNDAADEFCLGFLSMLTDTDVLSELFSPRRFQVKDQTVVVEKEVESAATSCAAD